MVFKIRQGSSLAAETPETLFRDLRSKRIPGLLSHQADILRAYVNEGKDKTNVALQLPTGSGKTLVGLLLAEWRRRRFEERVVYLCPTNQLVNQVADQAHSKYGIQVSPFTGRVRDYSPASKAAYQSGEVIAVTSYSALFNTNPFFDDPDLIVLDDAHAAENYISSFWSVEVSRREDSHQPLFQALIEILRPALAAQDFAKVQGEWNDSIDPYWVDKIPTPVLLPLLNDIRACIDAFATDLEIRYSWSILRDHLRACQLYIGTRSILIRPLIPPTQTHPPFRDATQRLFMSATLGEGGDLERVTGQKSIHRLAIPEGWDKQGIGRRFFMLPGRSLREEEVEKLVLDLSAEAGRSLMILPDERSTAERRQLIADRLGYPVFSAREIEDSKAPFIGQDKAVAVFANRYDGIDFPEEECRLLVLEGLPSAVNLQERFIVSRMGAVALLNDRIRTRIVQAFGRCTRSATDYSAIVVGGEELLGYLQKREGREFLHPELQAELRFGIEQSSDQTIDGFTENFRAFLRQADAWSKADNYIVSLREECKKRDLPGKNDLETAVTHEIDFQYALWAGDFEGAYQSAIKVLDKLSDTELQGYRALWSYLAGAAAMHKHEEGVGGAQDDARQHFQNAATATISLSWLPKLVRLGRQTSEQLSTDNSLMIVIERLEGFLQKMGTVYEAKFAEYEAKVRNGLQSEESTAFERGHELLGTMLGYDAGNRETRAAPDPWWQVDESLCFIFEDHSEAKNDRLSVAKARQAGTHPNWVRKNLPVIDEGEIVTVLISPVTKVENEAIPHLENVYHWDLNHFREWANKAISVVRELRKTFPGPGDLAWRGEAAQKFKQHLIAPRSLVQMVKARPAGKVLIPE